MAVAIEARLGVDVMVESLDAVVPEPQVRAAIDRHGRGAHCLARMLLRFGVSYESLVYRLHNLRLINAQGRDRLRRITWASLIEHISDDEAARSLLAARGARPERRPPALLATRCLHGALDGTVGPGLLARLLDGAWCAVLLFVALARSPGRGDCLYLAGSQVALEVFERRVG